MKQFFRQVFNSWFWSCGIVAGPCIEDKTQTDYTISDNGSPQ